MSHLHEVEDFDELEETHEVYDQKVSYRKYNVHEGIIFCIELSENMYQELSELHYKVQLQEILESLSELMSQLVITRPGTGVGCYFYNCNKDNSRGSIYEFFSLEDINVRNMKKLSDLLEDLSYERINLRKEFPFDESKSTTLESLLVLIQDQFSKEVSDQREFNNKKVFLFTDNDTPKEASDKEAKLRLRRLVDDINDNYINFTTFFIGKGNKPFDNTFYSDILKLSAKKIDEFDLNFDGPNTKQISASYIKSRVLRKKEIKRVMFQCPLILDDDLDFKIAVKGYTIFSHEKAGTRYKLVFEHENVRKETYSRRKILNGLTGEEVKDNIIKVYPYGDIHIELTENDFKKIQDGYNDNEPYLKLLGFRSPDKSLHFFNNIGKALFVVPDEAVLSGSIRTMASLFRTMKKKNRVAIMWGKIKSNSNLNAWILSPSNDNDPNEGFYLYKVPFLDEIRRFPALVSYTKNSELFNSKDYINIKRITHNIIGYFNLKNGYNASDFKNPSLQKHFKLLHDYLLQVETNSVEETLEERKVRMILEDDTLKKLSQIRERIIDSSKSVEPTKQRLSMHLNIWNDLYSKVESEDISSSVKFNSKKIKK